MSSVAVFEAATWVKSMYMTKLLLKTRKRENMEINEFFHKYPSNRWFRNGIHSC